MSLSPTAPLLPGRAQLKLLVALAQLGLCVSPHVPCPCGEPQLVSLAPVYPQGGGWQGWLGPCIALLPRWGFPFQSRLGKAGLSVAGALRCPRVC